MLTEARDKAVVLLYQQHLYHKAQGLRIDKLRSNLHR